MTKKVETSVTLARGGMHSVARYRAAKKMILECKYKKTRLYHFILKGSTNPKDYNKAAEAIVRMLRDNNMPCMGKGCYEVSDDKGLHFHLMLLVDAGHGGKVDWWLTVAEDGPLKTKLKGLKNLAGLTDDEKEEKGIKVHIAEPKNDMHRVGGNKFGKMPLYQYVSKSGAKLEDALKRISYLFKKDQKDDSMKRIYYSTREKTQKAKPEAVQTAEQASDAQAAEGQERNATTNKEKGNEMVITNLTPAGFTYLAKLYEQAVDQRMDVGAIHAYLTRKGVAVTRAEVIHQLEHVFSFPGYAAANPAKPILTFAEIDAQMRKPARRLPSKSIELVNAEVGV